jgi:hypothetical protein
MKSRVHDLLYLDEIRRARTMDLKDKIWAGAELFDMACEQTKLGIRLQHPEADEARVLELLRERIALGKRLEESR